MANFFRNQKIKTIIFSSVIIIFGLLFCVLPEKSIDYLELIVSIFLILYGVVCLFGFIFSPRELKDPLLLFESILMIVAGVLIDFFPFLFVIGIGTIILAGGLRQIYNSIRLRFLTTKTWWVDLILGVIFSILGIVIIVLSSTKVASIIISIMLGVTLILDGICYLVLLFALKREVSKIKHEVNEKIIIDSLNEED